MNSSQILKEFRESCRLPLLLEGKHGIEREALRMQKCGKLSHSAHPVEAGSPLFHPFITLDFAQAQVEFVTPAMEGIDPAWTFLNDLMAYFAQMMREEYLWSSSTPGQLDQDIEVLLAKFGVSQKGYEKWLYRKGLCYRYGKKMQLNSGVHFSFSFSEPLSILFLRI